MPTMVSKLFDKVLTLESGEVIELTFQTEKDLVSKKTMLFREKRKYEQRMKDTVSFKSFFIGQEVNKKRGVFKLKLSTNGTSLDWLTSAIIRDKEGDESKLEVEINTGETERINKLKNM